MQSLVRRAQLLMSQSRHADAANELRQALAQEPDDSLSHALLSLCLTDADELDEATAESQQAIHLAPDSAFAHYALARVMLKRNRFREAQSAIEAAIQLAPEDADFLGTLSSIALARRKWRDALDAAERGLRFDPEHVQCTNLRAMALVKLGRKELAESTIGAALARDPDNAVTHANQGWTLLEQNNPTKALEHFREALRLDPDLEFARAGIVEALKARHFIYRIMLRYFLAMSKLSAQAQWGILIGGYVISRLLKTFADDNPQWAPWIWPVLAVYIAFALMTWVAAPLFNLLLRLNRFGRLALSREQIVASNWLAACLLAAGLALAVWAIAPWTEAHFVAMVFGFLVLPMAATFNCHAGWPRRAMAIYTAALALLGLSMAAAIIVADVVVKQAPGALTGVLDVGVPAFTLGTLGCGWVANILMSVIPKR